MPKPIAGLTAAARAQGMPGGNYIPMGQIRWLLGHVHVGTSALTLARQYWHKRAKGWPRPLKRAVVRAVLLEHERNRGLYRSVMSGRF